MQWIYLICFILLSAGLLALFGVKPGDFIDALFRSQRKSATLSDELNVLLGTPAKGFFNQDYELKQILKGTGRADRYEAIKRLSLMRKFTTRIYTKANYLLNRGRMALSNQRGDFYISDAVKIIIAVVLGALLLAALTLIFNDTVIPRITEEIESLFS